MKLQSPLAAILTATLASARRPSHHHSPQQPLSVPPIVQIPQLGYGTWNLVNASAGVSLAIQLGYEHIDAAAAYGNQVEVGEGIRDGLARTGLSREDIWVTSKLWNTQYDRNEMKVDMEMLMDR